MEHQNETNPCFRPKHVLFGFITSLLLALRIYIAFYISRKGDHLPALWQAWVWVLILVTHWLIVETFLAVLLRWMWRFAVHESSKPAVFDELASATFVVLCYTSGTLLQKAISFTALTTKKSILANVVVSWLFAPFSSRKNVISLVLPFVFVVVKLFLTSLATPAHFCAFALDGAVMGTGFGLLLSIAAAVGALMWARRKKAHNPYRLIFTKTHDKRIAELLYPVIVEHNTAVDDDNGGVVFTGRDLYSGPFLSCLCACFRAGIRRCARKQAPSVQRISFEPLSTLDIASYTILTMLTILAAMAPKSLRLILQWRRLAFPKGTRSAHKEELMYYCAGNSDLWQRRTGSFSEINCVGSDDACALSTTVGRLKRIKDISGDGLTLWLTSKALTDRPLIHIATATRTPGRDMRTLNDFSDDNLVVM
eukprot:IDg22219t1